ncbi:MAG: hypothetical protein GC154_06970 [bacterium]|nr:hypothetical protein [bacterium]
MSNLLFTQVLNEAMTKQNPIITLLTDFGNTDGFIGVMKGVMMQIAPAARFVDISHELPAFSISSAAFLNAWSFGYFPTGSVHLCVVDPGVGTHRRALAVETQGHRFIAPDNGLLTPVLQMDGGATIVSLDNERYWLGRVSQTFHGRDIFSPAAAHLAAGVDIRDMGTLIHDPVMLSHEPPVIANGRIECRIRYIDRFGNLVTDLERHRFEEWVQANRCTPEDVNLIISGARIQGVRPTYGAQQKGGLVAVFNGFDRLEIAVTQGRANRRTGLGIDDTVVLLAPGAAQGDDLL